MTAIKTPEPWVDAATVGAHLSLNAVHIRRMAAAGRLPGSQVQNGARTFWRFRLSEVDAYMNSQARLTISSAMPVMSAMVDALIEHEVEA